MPEKRTVARHRALKAATIEFGGGVIDCMVRNVSDVGAALDVSTRLASPHISRWCSPQTGSTSPVTSSGAKKSGSAWPSTKAPALQASSQLLPIRVQIIIDRELKNAACGRTRSFFGSFHGAHAFIAVLTTIATQAQLTIISQANDVIGLTPVPNIRTEIYD